MKLSIIIPVFNEVNTIGEVIKRVWEAEIGMDREIVVVDDGSTDGTRKVLEDLEKIGLDIYDTEVLFLYASRNRGKGSAIRKGLDVVTGDIIVFQDADLELDPSEYPKLLAPILARETQVVFGSRDYWGVGGSHWTSRLANGLLAVLTTVLYGQLVRDMETAYKVMTRDAIGGIRLTSNGFDIEPEITSKLRRTGQRILEVPIDYHPRTIAEGKKMRWRDGFIAIMTLFKYRFTPLDSFLKQPSATASVRVQGRR